MSPLLRHLFTSHHSWISAYLHCLDGSYISISVVFVCLMLIICSYKTFMVSYRWDIVLTHCNIFIFLYCFILGTELSLVTTYIGLFPYLGPWFLCWLLLLYFGCRCLIMANTLFRLLLSHFAWLSPSPGYCVFYWPPSSIILLCKFYGFNSSIWSWNLVFHYSFACWKFDILMTILDRGTKFSLTV